MINGHQAKKELNEVHLLRAVASFMVCLFHLVCGNTNLFNDSQLKNIFSFGYLGVELFFLLSGFIICYSLPRDYSLSQSPIFLKKRLIRIEPPYLISIVLLLFLNYLSSKYTGGNFDFSWTNILYHLGYLNNFGLGEYYNVVYWTLGIEFQFYILIALLFPFIIDKNRWLILAALIFLVILGFIRVPGTQLIFNFLSIFILGILTYLYKIRGTIDLRLYLILSMLVLFLIQMEFGTAVLITLLFGLLIMNFYKGNNAVVLFLSQISYSLYLTHVFIGGKVINLGLRFAHSETARIILCISALIASVVFAYIFYLLVEKPTMRLSKKFNYLQNQ